MVVPTNSLVTERIFFVMLFLKTIPQVHPRNLFQSDLPFAAATPAMLPPRPRAVGHGMGILRPPSATGGGPPGLAAGLGLGPSDPPPAQALKRGPKTMDTHLHLHDLQIVPWNSADIARFALWPSRLLDERSIDHICSFLDYNCEFQA